MINSRLLIKYIFIVIEIIISQVLKKGLLPSFPLHPPDLIIYFYCWSYLHPPPPPPPWAELCASGIRVPSACTVLPCPQPQDGSKHTAGKGEGGNKTWYSLLSLAFDLSFFRAEWTDVVTRYLGRRESYRGTLRGGGLQILKSHTRRAPCLPATPKHLKVKIWGRPFPPHVISSGCK